MVGNGRRGRIAKCLRRLAELARDGVEAPASSRAVDKFPICHGEKPSLRVFRATFRGPFAQSGSEGLRHGVLGRRKIASANGKEGDELAEAFPRHAFDDVLDGLVAFPPVFFRYIAQMGRTSTVP